MLKICDKNRNKFQEIHIIQCMQRNEGKEHRNGEICELTVSNSEHKGSGHHPECCHQQVALLIALLLALWCLRMSHTGSIIMIIIIIIIIYYLNLTRPFWRPCFLRGNGPV